MSDFEKLNEIKKNVSTVYCPVILGEMNKKALELEKNIEKVKKLVVTFGVN